MKSRVSDESLQLPNSSDHLNSTTNLSHFLHKLELCIGENAEILRDHLNNIVASYEGQPSPLPPVEIPTSLTIQTAYGTTDEFSIYSWDERVEKYRCFDFDDFLTAIDIENNLGTDFEIIPCFWGDIRMKNHDDNNGIWAETIRIMKSIVSDEALQLPNSSSHLNSTTNLSRFL